MSKKRDDEKAAKLEADRLRLAEKVRAARESRALREKREHQDSMLKWGQQLARRAGKEQARAGTGDDGSPLSAQHDPKLRQQASETAGDDERDRDDKGRFK